MKKNTSAYLKNKLFLYILLICIFVSPLLLYADNLRTLPTNELLASAYNGGEELHYDVSWLGIKASKLIMRVDRLDEAADRFRITVIAKSAGLLAVFYPVEDRFETIVEGRERLPVRYDFWQKEGSRKSRKITTYDQKNFMITYIKDKQKEVIYNLDGPVHNEFSSFFAMRAMPFLTGKELIVPTFAEKKRHAIRVEIQKKKKLSSIFGKVEAVQVQPQLTFKGLYEKAGSPVIWFTDDEFRIPLRIKASIVIGSLKAKLVEYKGMGPPVNK